MFMIILFLAVGSVLAYISKNNLTPVSLHLGEYILSEVPLFYVIIGALLVGLVLSYVVYFFHDISTSFVIYGKKNEIKKNKEEVLELTKRVHQLELENEKLKHHSSILPEDLNAL